MRNLHKKIIKEVVEEKKRDPKVVSILLFGSLARGTAREDSDVDIEIIYDGGQYQDTHEYRYGIKVDYEIWPKEKLLHRIQHYPFLSYPLPRRKNTLRPARSCQDNQTTTHHILPKTS